MRHPHLHSLGRRTLLALAAVPAASLGVAALLTVGSPSAGARVTSAVAPVATGCPGHGGTSVAGLYAYGARLVSATDIPVCATGRIVVTFAGDPATGCAAAGLCAYSGTEKWRPQPVGDLSMSTVAQHGRRTTSASLYLGALGKPAAFPARHTVDAGAGASCSDRLSDTDSGSFTIGMRGGRAQIGLVRGGGALFPARCAGPLDADLASALPDATVALARLARGHLRVDLSGRATFAAHGFSGTVDSTVVLTLAAPRRQALHHKITAPPGTTPTREESVTYRVASLRGTTVAGVRVGGPASGCAALDACGLRGTITVVPHAVHGGVATIAALAPVTRPRRDLATALGLGQGGRAAGIEIVGDGQVASHGTVTADLAQGGTACRDRVRLSQTGLELRRRGDRLVVSVSPERSQAADPLRTRCPGPALGERHALAQATLPLSILSHPTFSLALHGTAFSDGPYQVRTRSTVRVTLHRVRVRSQVFPF